MKGEGRGKGGPSIMSTTFASASLVVLQDLLGHTAFKPYQEECVCRLLEGNDLLAVLPTGGGKSVIYQIPAIVLHTAAQGRRELQQQCLVVSPLISLISDQMSSLNRKLCVTASGTIVASGVDGVADRGGGFVAGNSIGDVFTPPFIFITPERFSKCTEAIRRMRLSLIVVDEAHCISGHGLSFREDYRQLGGLRHMHPFVPICALTATAPSEVSRDIVSLLGLRTGHSVVRAPIDRPNLRLSVLFRKKVFQDDIDNIVHYLGLKQGIIYFQTRDEVEKGAEALKSLRGLDIAPYHAGLAPEKRREVQDLFIAGHLQCVAATIAFGMGIDVPGVRCVVHYGLPATLENYLQEIGRAGRDGLTAECVLYWASSDAAARARISKDSLDPELASRGLRDMLSFAQTTGCLRQHLAKYFDDENGALTCLERGGEACIRCRDSDDRMFVEYGVESRSLMSTVLLVRAGVTKQLDYHTGRSGKVMDELTRRYARLHFGAGSNKPILFWKILHERLREIGHIRSDEHGVCYLTATGKATLESDHHLVFPEIVTDEKVMIRRAPKRPFYSSLEESSSSQQTSSC